MRFEDLLRTLPKDARDMERGPDCLSDGEIARLAVTSNPAAIGHVAGCDWCGARFKVAMGTEELTAEETLHAQRLAVVVPIDGARTPLTVLSSYSRWIAAAAAAVLAVAGLAIWRMRQDTAAVVATLLARAYTHDRQIEWRLPDAGWKRMTVQRSGVAARSLALLEAQAALAKDTAATPALNALRGRAELLDMRIEAAIPLLEQAVAAPPVDVDALIDLGIAHALRADSLGQPEGFGAAVEYLSRALQADPRHPRARFNRALAFERLHALERALAEWKELLSIEKGAGWAEEAREHIAALEKRLAGRAAAVSADEVTDAVYEGKAVQWLVSDRPRAQHAGAALRQIYRDEWLAAAASEPFDSRPLAAAWEAMAALRADEALGLAARAAETYSSSGAVAHALLARHIRLMAVAWRQDGVTCGREGATVATAASAARFHWIAAQALSQQASCLRMTGDLGGGLEVYQRSLEVARLHKLTGAELRIAAVFSAFRIAMGDPWSAWNESREMLAKAYAGPYSVNRVQQILANYSMSAEAWGWTSAAAEFSAAAADAVKGAERQSLEMANRSRAASLALAAGNQELASSQAVLANAHYSALPDSETRRRHLASLGLVAAEALSRSGRSAEAEEKAREFAGALAIDREQWRAKLLLGRFAWNKSAFVDARAAFGDAVAAVERSVASLPGSERARTRREAAESYRGLVETLLATGDSDGALRAWLAGHESSEPPSIVVLDLGDGFARWTEHGRRYERLRLDVAQFCQDVRTLVRMLASPDSPLDTAGGLARSLQQRLFAGVPAAVWKEPGFSILLDVNSAAVPVDYLLAVSAVQTQEASVISARPFRESRLDLKSALTVGSPLTPVRWAPLADSREEAREAATFWPASRTLADSEATLAAVLRNLPRHDLFHFSGHGYSIGGLGGLWLSTGPAGAGDFRALHPGQCRLAVLSACMTAGNFESRLSGPNGLVNAFLDAGVPVAVASRWNIDSAATRIFMRYFHRELSATGNVRRALRIAADQVRSSSAYAHPYYWAAFQIYA